MRNSPWFPCLCLEFAIGGQYKNHDGNLGLPYDKKNFRGFSGKWKMTFWQPIKSKTCQNAPNFANLNRYHQVRNIRSKKSPCIDFEISHVFMCQLSTHIKFSKLGQNKVKSALLAAHPQKVACILLLSCLNNQSPFLPFLRPYIPCM